MYAVWNNSASARAAMTDAKPNNNYIITVTDSAKYNIAVYGLTSDVSTPTSWANAKTGKYYQGDTSTPSFSNTATITADYFLLSLKKMDNTSFTEAELANGAEAVFTFTEG